MTDKARVCAAIRESTTAEAVQAMSRATGLADMVEVRADFIQDLELAPIFAAKSCPVLFTLRSPQEGGDFAGAERVRLETIVEAASLGADYVDVEYSAYWKAVLDAVPPERVILSSHNFEETPGDVEGLFDRMAETGAGIIKIATRANRLTDNIRIARLLDHAAARRVNLIALAMGRPGIPSRILGPSRGSWMTFASLPGSAPTADGQVRADEMQDLYRIRSITRATRLYGVAGKPIGHSLSPHVHNRAFAERGIDAVYIPLEAESVADLVEFADHFGLEGASVTIPFKEGIRDVVSSISVEAEQVGAVNTIVRAGSGWHGENSDVEGFLSPLKRRTFPGRLNCVVLGAGGAARAVVAGLRAGGSKVCVVARDPEKARRLAQPFGASWRSWGDLKDLEWDLLVNTTPVGMYPEVDQTPVPAELLKGEWVYDLVYRPEETRLLREAAARGCRTISGVDMFLGQAVKQHQIWCGTPVPHKEMAESLEAALAGRPVAQRSEDSPNA